MPQASSGFYFISDNGKCSYSMSGFDVVVSLKDRAKANHRSLEGETRSILTDQVRRASRMKEFQAKTGLLRSHTREIPQSDSVDLIREDSSR